MGDCPLQGLPYHKPSTITTYNSSINESLLCSHSPNPTLSHTHIYIHASWLKDTKEEPC